MSLRDSIAKNRSSLERLEANLRQAAFFEKERTDVHGAESDDPAWKCLEEAADVANEVIAKMSIIRSYLDGAVLRGWPEKPEDAAK